MAQEIQISPSPTVKGDLQQIVDNLTEYVTEQTNLFNQNAASITALTTSNTNIQNDIDTVNAKIATYNTLIQAQQS